MFKYKRHLSSLLLFGVLLVPLLLAAEEKNTPEIYIDKMIYDFGKVFTRPVFEHEFIIRNRGKADLIISRVKPG